MNLRPPLWTVLILLNLTRPSLADAMSSGASDPLVLTVTGTALGVPVNQSIDETSNISLVGFHLPIPAVSDAFDFSLPDPPYSVTINSAFHLQATLTGLDGDSRLSASVMLSGPMLVGLKSEGSSLEYGGDLIQPDQPLNASGLVLSPGVDPSMVPSWFTGLTVGFFGDVTGGTQEILDAYLFVYPGPTTSSQLSNPEPVPEPSALALGGLVIGVSVIRRLVQRHWNSRRQTPP